MVGNDSYYDVRDRSIYPLTSKLTRWQPEPVPVVANPPTGVAPQSSAPGRADELAAINASLQDIHRTLERMGHTMLEFVERMNDIVFGDPKRRRR